MTSSLVGLRRRPVRRPRDAGGGVLRRREADVADLRVTLEGLQPVVLAEGLPDRVGSVAQQSAALA
jgi:hypothetical protein